MGFFAPLLSRKGWFKDPNAKQPQQSPPHEQQGSGQPSSSSGLKVESPSKQALSGSKMSPRSSHTSPRFRTQGSTDWAKRKAKDGEQVPNPGSEQLGTSAEEKSVLGLMPEPTAGPQENKCSVPDVAMGTEGSVLGLIRSPSPAKSAMAAVTHEEAGAESPLAVSSHTPDNLSDPGLAVRPWSTIAEPNGETSGIEEQQTGDGMVSIVAPGVLERAESGGTYSSTGHTLPRSPGAMAAYHWDSLGANPGGPVFVDGSPKGSSELTGPAASGSPLCASGGGPGKGDDGDNGTGSRGLASPTGTRSSFGEGGVGPFSAAGAAGRGMFPLDSTESMYGGSRSSLMPARVVGLQSGSGLEEYDEENEERVGSGDGDELQWGKEDPGERQADVGVGVNGELASPGLGFEFWCVRPAEEDEGSMGARGSADSVQGLDWGAAERSLLRDEVSGGRGKARSESGIDDHGFDGEGGSGDGLGGDRSGSECAQRRGDGGELSVVTMWESMTGQLDSMKITGGDRHGAGGAGGGGGGAGGQELSCSPLASELDGPAVSETALDASGMGGGDAQSEQGAGEGACGGGVEDDAKSAGQWSAMTGMSDTALLPLFEQREAHIRQQHHLHEHEGFDEDEGMPLEQRDGEHGGMSESLSAPTERMAVVGLHLTSSVVGREVVDREVVEGKSAKAVWMGPLQSDGEAVAEQAEESLREVLMQSVSLDAGISGGEGGHAGGPSQVAAAAAPPVASYVAVVQPAHSVALTLVGAGVAEVGGRRAHKGSSAALTPVQAEARLLQLPWVQQLVAGNMPLRPDLARIANWLSTVQPGERPDGSEVEAIWDDPPVLSPSAVGADGGQLLLGVQGAGTVEAGGSGGPSKVQLHGHLASGLGTGGPASGGAAVALPAVPTGKEKRSEKQRGQASAAAAAAGSLAGAPAGSVQQLEHQRQLAAATEAASRLLRSVDRHAPALYLGSHGLQVLPPALASFSGLKTLDLSRNALVSIPAGTLPHSLHILDLSHNRLAAVEGLRDLSRLRVLNLSHNRITRIGHGLAGCASLKEVYLAGNKISEVEGLHRLLKLTVLDLSANKITSTKALGQLAANYGSLCAVNLLGNPIHVNLGEDAFKRFITGLLPNLQFVNQKPVKALAGSQMLAERSSLHHHHHHHHRAHHGGSSTSGRAHRGASGSQSRRQGGASGASVSHSRHSRHASGSSTRAAVRSSSSSRLLSQNRTAGVGGGEHHHHHHHHHQHSSKVRHGSGSADLQLLHQQQQQQQLLLLQQHQQMDVVGLQGGQELAVPEKLTLVGMDGVDEQEVAIVHYSGGDLGPPPILELAGTSGDEGETSP